MKAKLLCDAGEIPEGAEVEILSKVEDGDERKDGEAAARDAASPVYAVKDEASHEERVDTRDLRPSL